MFVCLFVCCSYLLGCSVPSWGLSTLTERWCPSAPQERGPVNTCTRPGENNNNNNNNVKGKAWRYGAGAAGSWSSTLWWCCGAYLLVLGVLYGVLLEHLVRLGLQVVHQGLRGGEIISVIHQTKNTNSKFLGMY